MSAELEDGFSRIANGILDHLMKCRLNGTQNSILYCVFRNTYGYQRKSHSMSLGFISTGTGIHKDLVKRELDKLIEMKVITVFKPSDYNNSREIGINKNTIDWSVYSGANDLQSTKQSTVDNTPILESPNQSTNKDKVLNKDIKTSPLKRVYEEESIPYRSAKYLYANILKFKPDLKKPNLQSWANDMRLMFEQDKREPKEAASVIEWVTKDPFWQANVLSASSLRKQWDKLTVKMKQGKPTNKAPVSIPYQEDEELRGILQNAYVSGGSNLPTSVNG